jgi:hypothetical protein
MALAREKQSATPKVFRALEAGPLPSEEMSAYADVFARGMSELNTFLNDD